MREYDILILGIETKNGQAIFSLLEQDYKYVSMAVPLSNYPPTTRFPQNQVKINFSDKNNIKLIASSFKMIVAFDKKNKYKTLIKESQGKFVDASAFSLQMVINILEANIPSFRNGDFNVNASYRNIFKFLFYPKRDYVPCKMSNTKSYKILIKEIELNSSEKFKINLIFQTLFCSVIFVILGFIFKPFIFLFSLFGLVTKLPFNENSNPKNSIFIEWKEETNDKKKLCINKKYIYPTQNENEIIKDYLILKLEKILKLEDNIKKAKKSIAIVPYKIDDSKKAPKKSSRTNH